MSFKLLGKAVRRLRLPTVNYENSTIQVIPAQSGDMNSRCIEIELYDDRGDINLSAYTRVMLNATLPDETKQVIEGVIDTEKNIAICNIKSSIIRQYGKVVCDISFYGKEENNEDIWLTSQTFYIFVAPSQVDNEAIDGTDEDNVLLRLYRKIEAEEQRAQNSEIIIKEQINQEIERAQIVENALDKEKYDKTGGEITGDARIVGELLLRDKNYLNADYNIAEAIDYPYCGSKEMFINDFKENKLSHVAVYSKTRNKLTDGKVEKDIFVFNGANTSGDYDIHLSSGEDYATSIITDIRFSGDVKVSGGSKTINGIAYSKFIAVKVNDTFTIKTKPHTRSKLTLVAYSGGSNRGFTINDISYPVQSSGSLIEIKLDNDTDKEQVNTISPYSSNINLVYMKFDIVKEPDISQNIHEDIVFFNGKSSNNISYEGVTLAGVSYNGVSTGSGSGIYTNGMSLSNSGLIRLSLKPLTTIKVKVTAKSGNNQDRGLTINGVAYEFTTSIKTIEIESFKNEDGNSDYNYDIRAYGSGNMSIYELEFVLDRNAVTNTSPFKAYVHGDKMLVVSEDGFEYYNKESDGYNKESKILVDGNHITISQRRVSQYNPDDKEDLTLDMTHNSLTAKTLNGEIINLLDKTNYIVYSDIRVAKSFFTVDNTYEGYNYKADIKLSKATKNMLATVNFDIDSANRFASVCETYDGGIYIWSNKNDAVLIPRIKLELAEVIDIGGSKNLEFTSNGDGTCVLTGIGACQDAKVNIPNVSPDFDVVISIGEDAFNNCQTLTNIVIPNSVTSIHKGAFRGCNLIKLYDFRNRASVVTLYDNDSLGHAINCQIVIPDDLYEEWINETNWNTLTNVIYVKESKYTEV
ncbi:MAG: leucine-rich repeat protein [Christensenellaceae bacterium]